MRDTGPLVFRLKVEDPALNLRLVEILADVPGVRIAQNGEPADATISEDGAAAASSTEGSGLTRREREVLALLTEGASNKDIARTLGISVHTAKFHVGRVIDKLDATGRTDAVAHAARTGVIHL